MIQNIKVQHLTLGKILDETFSNPIQFKLFLKLVNGCMETKNDLTFFNGNDFYTHVPYKILVECVITTSSLQETQIEQTLTSKIESVIKQKV